MDPLNFITPELFPFVFQHFDSSDVLRASEVCRTWLAETEASAICCAKLQLFARWGYVFEGEPEDEDNRLVTQLEDIKSSRLYMKIKIELDCRTYKTPAVADFFEFLRGRMWKQLDLLGNSFDMMKLSEYENFYKLFESSVEILKIRYDSFEAPHYRPVGAEVSDRTQLTFPKLKDLTIKLDAFCPVVIFESMSRHCKVIESLTIEWDSVEGNNVSNGWSLNKDFINEILVNNVNLKNLRLINQEHPNHERFLSSTCCFPKELLPRLRFHLKTFHFELAKILTHDEPRLLKFLKSQDESLETLYIKARSGSQFGSELIKTAFKMLNLKELTLLFESRTTANVDDFELNVNPSIEKFYFRGTFRDFNGWEKILTALPNLKWIRMKSLSQEILKLLSQHCQKVEEIWTDCDLKIANIKVLRFNLRCLPNLQSIDCTGHDLKELQEPVTLTEYSGISDEDD